MQQTDSIKSIAIVGFGNVGWHLAIALSDAGYEITNIVSRTQQSDNTPSEFIDTSIVKYLSQIREEPDLYLLTVQDSEIDAIAALLSDSDKIIVHTSGGRDMSVFSDKRDNYGVFYPLQTFTKGSKMSYSEIPFLLEADSKKTENALKGVAEKISGSYRCVGAEERLSLHIAAVFACNFSNHMVNIAEYLLKKDNLDLELIQPLLMQTLKKLDDMSPKEAQTGPAIRNDHHTMNRHLEVLEKEPELKDLYIALSQSIQNSKI